MPVGSTTVAEPSLAVRSRPAPFGLRRRFLVPFGAALACVIAGLAALVPSGNLLLPFEQTTVLEGKMASKGDFFEDPEVKRLLMRHHLQVHVTRTGSRDVALHELAGYDVVFPSGQPSADLIIAQRQSQSPPAYTRVYRPFTSPIVLATYREYAQTLEAAKIATPLAGAPEGHSLYYSLDLAKFLAAAADPAMTWNKLGLKRFDVSNGNAVLAHSPNVCSSNSSGTYMGLVAFVSNGNRVPRDLAEATALAQKIKPLVTAQGLPGADLFRPYITPEGKGSAPVIVVYEHQFLSYQMGQKAHTGHVDDSRVLLYPDTNFLTQPQLIALNPQGDRLSRLVTEDPDLRRRAVELGFRVLAPDAVTESLPLAQHLAGQGVQVPEFGGNDTKAVLPELPLFEEMIKVTGGCP
ncbi:hypothetical protein [Catellatospora sp. TT07R-123]|uniref:hypothetical protein n=1 Tax=Catellatospora sp. TT07R-123 TaxID=2733863 RepID=UPI001BB31F6D|nr:hypothetical protein [Catellatospora sp. TT07R-123]